MIKLVKSSSNSKLGKGVATSYRAVGQTCPSSCQHLQSNSCYAMFGFVALHQRKAGYGKSDGEKAYDFIKSLPSGAVLRHHVSGDFFVDDKPDEDYIGNILKGHKERPDIAGWTYTHGWKQLNSKEMNSSNLAVNASCDNVPDLIKAISDGWPATITVSEDTDNHVININDEKIHIVICPQQQNSDVTCKDCGLCIRKDRKSVVGFRLHGTGKSNWRKDAS